MKLYATAKGLVAENDGQLHLLQESCRLDSIFADPDPSRALRRALARSRRIGRLAPLRAPLQSQEVWAAGVTYRRSRTARMDESKASGGGSFYDRVYSAERPELFFKATPHRVAASGQTVRIRSDSKWNVPEPELTLAISARGRIFGYTIGNDMSSRDIEGENPLYLPQAKVYDRSAAIGPCILVTDEPPGPETEISIEIRRGSLSVFTGATRVGEIKRSFAELAGFLFRDNSFPAGCFLMTGTGVVPGDGFTLQPDDRIAITIPAIGTLVNRVARS
jgi:2-dehydro-3-deoxy-D-arabinonate dehydratase